MGYPTGDRPEHNPSYGPPPQGNPQPSYPQQGYPVQGGSQYPWQPVPYDGRPGWGGPGPDIPGGKPPGGGSGRALAIIGVITVLLVAAIVAVGVIVVRTSDSDSDDSVSAAGSSSSAGPTAPTTPSTTTSPSEPQCPAPKADPGTPAGWKTVSGSRGLAYDVPPDWEVESCGTVVGWEGKCADGPFGYCPIRTMSGAATLHSAQCPKNSVALAGTPGASDTDDINVAVRAEAGLVKDIYTSESGRVPDVSLSAPDALTVGGAPAVQIIAKVSGIEGSACVGTTALHSMIATTVPGQEGCVMFVISLQSGVPGAPDPIDIGRLMSSLRRAG